MQSVKVAGSHRDDRAQRRVIVVDPVIGEFSLRDRFVIELRDHLTAVADEENGWRKVSVAELLDTVFSCADSEGLGSEDVQASPDLNNSDVLETKLFTCSYADEFTNEQRVVLPTPQQWERTMRKACKALFIRDIPHFVLSGYSPTMVQRTPIILLVPAPRLALDWLCKMQFDRDSLATLQVVDPETGLRVKLTKG